MATIGFLVVLAAGIFCVFIAVSNVDNAMYCFYSFLTAMGFLTVGVLLVVFAIWKIPPEVLAVLTALKNCVI